MLSEKHLISGRSPCRRVGLGRSEDFYCRWLVGRELCKADGGRETRRGIAELREDSIARL
jgi:hypothetical protein